MQLLARGGRTTTPVYDGHKIILYSELSALERPVEGFTQHLLLLILAGLKNFLE